MLGTFPTRGFREFWGLGLVFCILFVSVSIQSNQETMKVHPMPKKRNITFQYDISSSLSEAANNFSSFPLSGRQKKLRRLPHIFSRVLELPFRSDADVSIQETRDCFRFVTFTDELSEDVEAQIIEIYPGVTKIVVRASNALQLTLDELELDMWRFRLPQTTRPELATAIYVDGELTVTVPKGAGSDNSDGSSGEEDEEEGVWGDEHGDFAGGFGRLVAVQ
eukprot:TRINITY_DN2008_c0_g1_i1.p1 TRINITY_DN2008_c0_g1~~TRINITY_DN2008_c0_g1_i1.p1  ORF type:complete len:221 (-),score=18.08 TRINITY_DN2008_c0_g1_i1:303-965(-)